LESLNTYTTLNSISHLDPYLQKIRSPRRRILNFLYSRHANRMHRKKEYCNRHGGECLYVFYSTVVPVIEPIKMCERDYNSHEEMIYAVHALLQASYYLVDNVVFKRQSVHWNDFTEFYRDLYMSDSQINIKPMTRHKNNPQQTNYSPSLFMRPVVRRLSEYYWRKAYGIEISSIRDREEERLKKGDRIMSLQEMCMLRLEWERIIYDTVEGYKQIVYATNDIGPGAMIKLYKEFAINTSLRGESYISLMKLMRSAVRDLNYAIGADKFIGKISWKYDVRNTFKMMKYGTSGGILPANSGSVVIDGVLYKMMNRGAKIFHVEAAVRDNHYMMYDLIHGIPHEFQPASVTVIKHGVVPYLKKRVDQLREAQWKKREFFYTSTKIKFNVKDVAKRS